MIPRIGFDMLRLKMYGLGLNALRRSFAIGPKSSLPAPPLLEEINSSEEMSQARTWAEKFRAAAVPRETVQLSFSRSSGPGGQVRYTCSYAFYAKLKALQNVNKVNTKCTVRCQLSSNWIPLWAKSTLRKNVRLPYAMSHEYLLTYSSRLTSPLPMSCR